MLKCQRKKKGGGGRVGKKSLANCQQLNECAQLQETSGVVTKVLDMSYLCQG